MKQLILRIKGKIPLFVFCFSIIAVGCQLFAVSSSQAQISSAAFDPNCYQPVIGTPGVIDTIYGSHYQEQLGSFVKNLWPENGSPYGKIIIDTGSDYYIRSVHPLCESGPNFNLHKLQTKDTFNLGYLINPRNLVKRGHFRSRQYTDVMFTIEGSDYAPRIYWADDNGRYDSTHYTELRTSLHAPQSVEYNKMNYYTACLSTDSVLDIISGVILHNVSVKDDSLYILYFKGGETLYNKGSVAVEDSSIYVGIRQLRTCTQGDFRGIGREDLIANDRIGNVFFYKNDVPFILKNLTHSIFYDTLMAIWQNPKGNTYFDENQLVMHAFNKQPGDTSMDFLPVNGNIGEVHIYKGGPDFGSHRLFEDQADFILHPPSYYDSKWNGVNVGGSRINCGKMSGTNNNVLWRIGGLDGGFYGYDFFYVLGDAMDDKVDMFYSNDNSFGSSGGVDTLTADGDKFQDVIISHSTYGKDNGNDWVGTVLLVHGSNKIPNRINEVLAPNERRKVDASFGHVSANPNPCGQITTLTFDNCTSSTMQVDICTPLGVVVKHEETPAVDGLQQYAPDLSELSAGMYILRLTCPAMGWVGSVNVIKTGEATKPWSMDLKKMVGR